MVYCTHHILNIIIYCAIKQLNSIYIFLALSIITIVILPLISKLENIFPNFLAMYKAVYFSFFWVVDVNDIGDQSLFKACAVMVI